MAIVCEIKVRAADKRARDAKIKEMIQSPDADFVAMAIRLVNLDATEKTVVDLCLQRGLTQEQAAEELDCSVDAVQKWSRTAKDKIWTVWSGRWWMRKIMDV